MFSVIGYLEFISPLSKVLSAGHKKFQFEGWVYSEGSSFKYLNSEPIRLPNILMFGFGMVRYSNSNCIIIKLQTYTEKFHDGVSNFFVDCYSLSGGPEWCRVVAGFGTQS